MVFASFSSVIGQIQDDVALLLREEWAVEFPNSVQPLWLTLSGGGAFLIQTTGGLHYAESPLEQPSYLGSFESLDVVGAAIVGNSIELLDAKTRRVVTVDFRGRSLGWRDVSAAGVIQSATRSSCGWVLALSGATGSELVLEADNGEVAWRVESSLGEVALTENAGAVVATETKRPFRITRLDCDRPDKAAMGFGQLSDAYLPNDSWTSLPAFSLGRLTVRTLVDVSSDHRILMVYGQAGELLRESRIDAPIGLVSAWGEHTVVGVRRLDRLEVVGFTAGTKQSREGGPSLRPRGDADSCTSFHPGTPPS